MGILLEIAQAARAPRASERDAAAQAAYQAAYDEGFASAKAAGLKEFGAVVASLWPGVPRAELFAEALAEGASVNLATKMALKVSTTPGRVALNFNEPSHGVAPRDSAQAFEAGAAAAKELISKVGFARDL